MLNYKNIAILFFAVTICLCGCKPATKLFSYNNSIDTSFFATLRPMLGMSAIGNDSIIVYRALLEEKLVERDDLPEYKLMNEKSEQKKSYLPNVKGHHELYLFELFPANDDGDTMFVYLGTTFSEQNVCSFVGPAYAGVLQNSNTASEILFTTLLNVKRQKRKNLPAQEPPLSDSAIKSMYYLEKSKAKTNITFINRFPLIQTGKDYKQKEYQYIQVDQVIRDERNKIGGDKAILFSMKDVFGDEKALVFSYFGKIKNTRLYATEKKAGKKGRKEKGSEEKKR